ncbi:retrovirus-related pol polyprotein from transposon TNT 1-94, partial [Tanacetum coccineum]
PLSRLSTPTNPLPKPQNQWSHADRRLVNQDKRLKSILISCLPNDVMKSVIKCTTAKAIWTDLIFAHEGPSETKDIKIAALRLKFNAFKALEGEKVNETFTRLKSSLNDPENNDVSIPQAEVNAAFVNSLPRKWLSMNQTQRANNSINNDNLAALYGKYNYEEGLESDSDIEEDQRSSSEFLANLNAEFHERTLPANQRRFYKRSGRVGSLKKPMDRVKYKGLKAKNAVLTKKIDAMNKGKSEKGLALMVVADEELSVGRTDARSYQWVEITMQKVQKLLSLTDSDERKHVLDYTHVNLQYVEDQRKNLLNKFHTLKQEFSSCKFELNDLNNTKALNLSFQSEITKLSLEKELLGNIVKNIVKAIGGKGTRKEKISSKEVVFTKSNVSSETCLEIPSDSESEGNTQIPLPSLPKLIGAEPSGVTKCLTLNNTKQTTDKVRPHHPPLNQEVLACEKGKHHRASFKTKRSFSINKCLHLLHMDLFRPVKPQSISHNKYTLVIVDEYSRYTWVFCLKKKSDAADCIISFIRKMENLNEVKVKELRSDNEKGISQNFSSPYTPEQNDVAERRNITLIEEARTMLNMKRHGKTAYDIFRGRSPDISYFHVFGCPVHIHNYRDHLGKFDENANDGFFLSYSLVAKAFRVFNIRRQEMEETYHVTFSEDDEAISQSSTEGDIKPKRLIEALEEEGWIIAMYEELNQLKAIIIFLAYAAYMGFMVYQIDMKSAFLNGKISEEVYVQQPPGFKSSEFPNHVCKLDKALYGLIQAPRAWYETLSKFLTQHKFVRDLLKKFDLADSASIKCHMLPTNNLGPDDSGVSVNEIVFRGMIGYLMYLTASRPNIQFSTCLCARYQANPKESHLVAVKRIFRTLWECHQLKLNMLLLLDDVLKSSGSKVSWLTIMCYMTRYHFIRDHILKGDIELHFVPTDLQLADIFTKPLAEPSFTRLVAELGMLNITSKVYDLLLFLSNSYISKALTIQPSAMYAEYLKDFWYSAKVKDNAITFSLSHKEKPLTFDRDLFSFVIGLDYTKKFAPLPTHEEVKEGLGTLGGNQGSHDHLNVNQQTIAFALCWDIDIDIAGILYNDLITKLTTEGKKGREKNITDATFKDSKVSEVPLTSHMRRVSKLPEKPLNLPSEDANIEATGDKSLSRTSVHPVSTPKAKIGKKRMKKKNPSSSELNISTDVAQTLTPQASESQASKAPEVPADISK